MSTLKKPLIPKTKISLCLTPGFFIAIESENEKNVGGM